MPLRSVSVLPEEEPTEYRSALPHRMGQEAVALVGNYEVFFGKKSTGTVQVQPSGLYYRIICRCQLSGDVICRLYVTCGERKENLGILVPVNGMFGLDTKIPVKRLGSGKIAFLLAPKREPSEGTFAPIYPEEPFAYIGRLKESFLQYKNGQMGIIISAGTE